MSKRERKSHIWDRDPHDWYVEPEWCSLRLFREERFQDGIHDPAAGIGTIIGAAVQSDLRTDGADIIVRAECVVQADFLARPIYYRRLNIVSNPPFKIAEPFVRKALDVAVRKVAMLLPAKWALGDKRSRWLETTPLKRVLFLTPRPSMPPGAVIMAGEKPGNGTADFAWFVWEHGYQGRPMIGWLRRG